MRRVPPSWKRAATPARCPVRPANAGVVSGLQNLGGVLVRARGLFGYAAKAGVRMRMPRTASKSIRARPRQWRVARDQRSGHA